MGAGWTTGGVRARALLRRRLGVSGARRLAGCASLADAVIALRQGPYRHDVQPGQELEEAEHAVTATLLWNLRVLAGWQPRAGAEVVRLLAGWFEIANTVDHARALVGHQAPRFYRLGTLASAWPRLSVTSSPNELRAALTASVWGDPGGSTAAAIAVAMPVAWADRICAAVPDAALWAAGRAAQLVARQRFLLGQELTAAVARRVARVLGARALEAGSWVVFGRALQARARWALAEVAEPAQLWRAETRWWVQVEREGFALLRQPRFGVGSLVGCVAVLAADAWRVRAALQIAARGGRELESFDALG